MYVTSYNGNGNNPLLQDGGASRREVSSEHSINAPLHDHTEETSPAIHITTSLADNVPAPNRPVTSCQPHEAYCSKERSHLRAGQQFLGKKYKEKN
ncbi:hypothetical protein RRG08_032119 [Elysia crispata]|uniref:Uncharacterized protein n=1 Tax=Elysia crispata TaxID=231223 RepID=A0AAE1DE80_9GAST|nr:hypothetical protein RRG08_032119 [Elysia crispata]